MRQLTNQINQKRRGTHQTALVGNNRLNRFQNNQNDECQMRPKSNAKYYLVHYYYVSQHQHPLSISFINKTPLEFEC